MDGLPTRADLDTIFRSWRTFGETLCTIPTKQGGERIPFRPNPVQRLVARRKAQAIAEGRRPWFLIPKARRMGITTREAVVSLYRTIRFQGQNSVILAHKDDAVEDQFRDCQALYRSLPEPFQLPTRYSNRREIVMAEGGSSWSVGSMEAPNVKRGSTLHRVHLTEAAHVRSVVDVEELISSLGKAASHGDMTAESTGAGCSGWFYDRCIEAAQGRGVWTLIFLPWFLLPEYATGEAGAVGLEIGKPRIEAEAAFVDGEAALVELARSRWGIEIRPEQLAWRRREWAADPKFFRREFPETLEDCFLVSARIFFDVEQVRAGARRACDPVSTEQRGEFRWSTWAKPKPGRRYLIGMDVSEGVAGGDHTYASVHDWESLEQVACGHGLIEPADGARFVAAKAREYNLARIAPERNNHGHTVIATLRSMGYPAIYRAEDDRYGWLTDLRTRPTMLDGLREAMRLDPPLAVRDAGFWSECLTFEDDGNGKFAATGTNKDDRVMAVAIALEARRRWRAPGIFLADPDDEG